MVVAYVKYSVLGTETLFSPSVSLWDGWIAWVPATPSLGILSTGTMYVLVNGQSDDCVVEPGRRLAMPVALAVSQVSDISMNSIDALIFRRKVISNTGDRTLLFLLRRIPEDDYITKQIDGEFTASDLSACCGVNRRIPSTTNGASLYERKYPVLSTQHGRGPEPTQTCRLACGAGVSLSSKAFLKKRLPNNTYNSNNLTSCTVL